jgi:L-threonylcarbamoyladenylate synthase
MFPTLQDESTRDRVLSILRSGGVIVLPTDTLPGMSALVSSQSAVARIGAIKGASAGRAFVWLASSADMVSEYVSSFGCESRETLEARWPAPLTVVLPASSKVPGWVGDTVAIRVPQNDALRELIAVLNEPMVSTSVNRTGEPPLTTAALIGEQFGRSFDMIVDGEATEQASTIVDLCGDEPKLLRQGSYTWTG